MAEGNSLTKISHRPVARSIRDLVVRRDEPFDCQAFADGKSLQQARALSSYLQARIVTDNADLAQDTPLFTALGNRAGGGHLTARRICRVVVDLMEKAGHVHRDADGKIPVHAFCRPIPCAALPSPAPLITSAWTPRRLAGHADPKTTHQSYVRVRKVRVLRSLAVVLDLEVKTIIPQ